jgi:hypothetical protein
MAKKKLRSNALYFNLGLAVIWDVIGFFFFFLSLFAIGIPFSVVLDFVAIGTALLFRFLHKGYFLKTTREIKADFKAIEKVVKRSKKKAIAQQYAKARGQLDQWVDQGAKFLMREIIRMLMTFLLELMPFLGDFSPTWTIKAYFELYKFGQQKKKYQLLLYQIDAMTALLKAEEKLAPGYAQMKRGMQGAQRIANGDFSGVQERIPGRQQYQNVKQGVQNVANTAQSGVTAAGAALGSVKTSLATAQASNSGYQQRVQREQMIEQQRVRYNESRTSGEAYYHSPSVQGSSLNQSAGQNIRDNSYLAVDFSSDKGNQPEGKNNIQPFSRKSNDSNESKKTQKELQNA